MLLEQTCHFDFICKDRTSVVLLARQVLFTATQLRWWTNSYTFNRKQNKKKTARVN